eukprot:826418_1
MHRVQAMEMCGIHYRDIHGWIDGNSFDINEKIWFNYSSNKNHINSTYLTNQIKLGLFHKRHGDNVYIYGHRFDSIQMPSVWYLRSNHDMMIIVARYHGNDGETLFVSKDNDGLRLMFDNDTIWLGHDHTTAVIYECENWSRSK